MYKEIVNKTILKYLKLLNNTNWIEGEAYKFEFANYLQNNVNFSIQTDEDVLVILLKSQKIKYDSSTGIQFIQKSGRVKLSTFIDINDIPLLRQFHNHNLEEIDWSNRTMTFTALSAWLSSLFPDKLIPVPTTGIDKAINYMFETKIDNFPKKGLEYIIACQYFMKQTKIELKNYPFEEIHLKIWNSFYRNNPNLNIEIKNSFNEVDWNWLTQDFYLFVYRNVLDLYKPKDKENTKVEDEYFEPIGVEGQSKLAIHMRYERDNTFIKKIKTNAIKLNSMLNCEVCGFSFVEKYGELGQGFIEAHHINPLNETKETKTSKQDIALVCSNCHRMLHKEISKLKNNSIMTIDELKNLLIE